MSSPATGLDAPAAEGEATSEPRPRTQAHARRAASLDLPGVLSLALLAATSEFLVVRVVTLAAAATGDAELAGIVRTLSVVGSFSRNLAALLAIVLLADAVVCLVRDPTFGPVTHRVTVSGFAAIAAVVCAASTVARVGVEPSLMAYTSAVLFASLLVLALVWHRARLGLVVGAVLLLLPTLLRFYASCAISVPQIRVESPIPLVAYHAAEVTAVLAAIASPFLLAGVSPRTLPRRGHIVSMGLASLPAVALATAMAGAAQPIRALCRSGVGFDLAIPLGGIVYPSALFFFLFAVATLVLPGIEAPRSLDEQRVGYGMAFLFLAGLDGLDGAVAAIGASPADVRDLVQYLLEGNWQHMTPDQQSLVGPPLRELYRVLLLALGYVLVARGVHGQTAPRPLPGTREGGQQ